MDFLQLFFSVKKDTYHKVLTKSWKNIFFSNGVLIPTLHPLFKKGGSLRQPLKCDCFCKAPFLAGKNWDCFPNYLTDFRTKKWLMSGNWMPIVHPLVVWRVEGGVHLTLSCGGFQVQDCEKHVIVFNLMEKHTVELYWLSSHWGLDPLPLCIVTFTLPGIKYIFAPKANPNTNWIAKRNM